MKEYCQDTQRANDAHKEVVDSEETTTQCAPVGELILDKFLRNIPANEQACEESADRKEYLSGHEVEYIEE